MFQPKYFFTKKTSHISLFEGVSFVWDVVKKIPDYLKSLPLGKIEVSVPKGVILENEELISIGKGTVLEPGAYIRGPAFIGKNCEIRHGSYIRGSVILDDGAIVGHASEVKQSFLFSGAQVAHFNYVGDSILGAKSHLGAGVICSNLRLDEANIFIYSEGKKIDTGLRKLGVILGDGAQIGCNTVINPGTLIGKDVVCYPNLTLQGIIPPNVKVKQVVNYTFEELS